MPTVKKIRTTPTPGSQLILKSVDASALTATALLTYPEIDYAGDWVQPDGGIWEPNLYVRTGVPLDKAHGEKVGRGTVEMVRKSIEGKEWSVPLGTTHFTRGNRLAEQTFRLVADDVMTGVSLEFAPLQMKSMGTKCPLPQEHGRDSMNYSRWHAYGWAHDIQPINANARTLLPDVVAKAKIAIDKAIMIAETGRYGSELQHPLIIKSFSRLVPPTRFHRVEKAMDFGNDTDSTVMPTDSPADAMPTEGTDTYPTAATAFDFAQAILDACDMAEQGLENGEHVKGMNKLRKLIEDVRAYADDCSAVGEMVESDLDGKMDDKETAPESPTETDDTADSADDDEEPVVEKAVVRKGLLITKSGYVPKRFRMSDFKPASAPIADLELKAAAEQDAKAAKRRARRALREMQPFLDALEVNS